MAHKPEVLYRRYFKHWRNGKTYDAHDYGLKVWPIFKSKKQ